MEELIACIEKEVKNARKSRLNCDYFRLISKDFLQQVDDIVNMKYHVSEVIVERDEEDEDSIWCATLITSKNGCISRTFEGVQSFLIPLNFAQT